MDERWTPGQGDERPSPPPDPEGPHSGESAPPEAPAAEEPQADTDIPESSTAPEEPGEVDSSAAPEDGGSGAATQEPKSSASPYRLPTSEGTDNTSWSWTFAGKLDDGWGATGSTAARSWPEEAGSQAQPPTDHGRPTSDQQPSEPQYSDASAESPDAFSPEAYDPYEPRFHTDPTQDTPETPGADPIPSPHTPWEDPTGQLPYTPEQPSDHHQPWEPPTTADPTAQPYYDTHQTNTPPHEPWEHFTSSPTTAYDPYEPRFHTDPTYDIPDRPAADHSGGYQPYEPSQPAYDHWAPSTADSADHTPRSAQAPPPAPFGEPWERPAASHPTDHRHEPRQFDGASHWSQEPPAEAAPPGYQSYGSEQRGEPFYEPEAAAKAEPPTGDLPIAYQPSDPNRPPAAGAAPPSSFQGPDDSADWEEPPRRRSRKGLIIGILSTMVALALVGGGVSWYVLNMPKPEETAQAYTAALASEDYGAAANLATGEDVEETLTRFADNLGITGIEVELGQVSADGDSARTSYEVTLSLKNAGDWSYEGELPLTRNDGEWLVEFSPSVMHPDLGEGETLTRVNAWGERGRILAADGSRLDTEEGGGSIGMIVGEVGAATEDDLERLGPAYNVGDPTGVSGLQRTYEERLAGEAGTSIRVVNEGEEEEAAAQEEPIVVESIEGTDGEDVQTSLDPAVQSAAAQAINGESDPTALVAVRPSTGEVLAAANIPGGYNRAFEGQYAPGSSFKIVSYQALLGHGLTADATMTCPETAEVGGWEFKNAGDAEYGRQSVTEAFATSCNTALVQEVANRLDSQALTATAEQFGMNSDLDIGVPTTEPAFPAPDSTTMLAAQSIGQGQILTSPLHMATVPAAVADGSWRSPTLVNDPQMEDQPEPAQIAHADQLRPMMREVVTEGTADDAGFNGEVYGKTGSAEYGTAEDEDDELDSHAWFVGYKGDVAFAVVVEGGGSGGKVAGPIAAAFADAI